MSQTSQFQEFLSRIRPPSPLEIVRSLRAWVEENWRFWCISAAVHGGVLCLLVLTLGVIVAPKIQLPQLFEAAKDNALPESFPIIDNRNAPLDPSALNAGMLMDLRPIKQTAEYNDDSKEFEKAGGGTPQKASENKLAGLGGFEVKALGDGPIVKGLGGVGAGEGLGGQPGVGGKGDGFGHRGKGHRDEISGVTEASERAVAAALSWFARHQRPNGSWSLNHKYSCRDNTCTSAGVAESDSAATALALLTFLAAGETPTSGGPYSTKVVGKGVGWLVQHQGKDGNLAAGSKHLMYSHALATIALCEAYGMSHDPHVGKAAQAAIDFLEKSQNASTGGWRYLPGDAGDTSVFGWAVMALKSGQMAGLRVNYETFQGAERWIQSVASGTNNGLYAYMPNQEPTPSMTAIGLLCRQYMGLRRDAPAMREGVDYLMANLPANSSRDNYYWYYASQAMHNLPGPQWDDWNRTMRRILIESQATAGCATGSWSPDEPERDAWGHQGGRHMVTALATLTLEVYYRYLPLFQLDAKSKKLEAGKE